MRLSRTRTQSNTNSNGTKARAAGRGVQVHSRSHGYETEGYINGFLRDFASNYKRILLDMARAVPSAKAVREFNSNSVNHPGRRQAPIYFF